MVQLQLYPMLEAYACLILVVLLAVVFREQLKFRTDEQAYWNIHQLRMPRPEKQTAGERLLEVEALQFPLRVYCKSPKRRRELELWLLSLKHEE